MKKMPLFMMMGFLFSSSLSIDAHDDYYEELLQLCHRLYIHDLAFSDEDDDNVMDDDIIEAIELRYREKEMSHIKRPSREKVMTVIAIVKVVADGILKIDKIYSDAQQQAHSQKPGADKK